MSSSEATLQEQLDAINVKILDAIQNAKPSYTLGDRKVDWNTWYNWLLKTKKEILAEMASIPAIEKNIATFGGDCHGHA